MEDDGVYTLGEALRSQLKAMKAGEYPIHEIVYDEKFAPSRLHTEEPCDTGCENLSRYNKDWWLSPIGDMVHVVGYIIPDYQLKSDWMFKHLMNKTWFDANTFLPAYMEACRRADIKKIEIDTGFE